MTDKEGTKKIGIIPELKSIGDELLEIAENESPEDREEIYQAVADRLEELSQEINSITEPLKEEVPEAIAKITRDIDEGFLSASQSFLDAIELYFSFLEEENPDIIKQAQETIIQGISQLERADVKAQALAAVTGEAETRQTTI